MSSVNTCNLGALFEAAVDAILTKSMLTLHLIKSQLLPNRLKLTNSSSASSNQSSYSKFYFKCSRRFRRSFCIQPWRMTRSGGSGGIICTLKFHARYQSCFDFTTGTAATNIFPGARLPCRHKLCWSKLPCNRIHKQELQCFCI